MFDVLVSVCLFKYLSSVGIWRKQANLQMLVSENKPRINSYRRSEIIQNDREFHSAGSFDSVLMDRENSGLLQDS